MTHERTSLRRVQGVAASLWALYGVLIHSLPVLVANILVAATAIVSSFRKTSSIS